MREAAMTEGELTANGESGEGGGTGTGSSD